MKITFPLHTFGAERGGPNVVGTIVNEELKPVLLGQDPFFGKKLRADLWKATEYQSFQPTAPRRSGLESLRLQITSLVK